MRVLSILFNTDMVRAILDGRKTGTRRVVKPQPPNDIQCALGYCVDGNKNEIGKFAFGSHENGGKMIFCRPPYQLGDILYVRETWFYETHMEGGTDRKPDLPSGRYSHRYIYRSDSPDYPVDIGVGATGWRPSIHMPKEAARIFLRVTDVRVERLRDITYEQALKEGAVGVRCDHDNLGLYGCTDCMNTGWLEPPEVHFMYIRDSTIKKSDLDKYGWEANPWVWAIEFERCEKPEDWN